MATNIMATNMKIYNIDDYDRIKREGISYILPEDVIRIIKSISMNVGAPEYVKTPHFEKNVRKSRMTKEIDDESWDNLRNFKPTTIEKKNGVELSIDLIRKQLNKISDKTYESTEKEIITNIDLIIDQVGINKDELMIELNKVGDEIFKIASGNSFYSKIYVTLYKVLINKYDFMNTIFTEKLKESICILDNFEYCDPAKDYDKFCQNNKTNEKRKALCLFYVNLMMQKIIKKDKIISMIEQLQEKLMAYIKVENNVNISEEISELIYIITTNGFTELKELDKWKQIVECISFVSEIKPKSMPSISNKTIFKHMDIQTILNK